MVLSNSDKQNIVGNLPYLPTNLSVPMETIISGISILLVKDMFFTGP